MAISLCVNRFDHHGFATVRDLLGMLIDGAGWRGTAHLPTPAGCSRVVRPTCERERSDLCERINASLNVYAQVRGCRTIRQIIENHAE